MEDKNQNSEYLPINSWSSEDRPREKLMHLGKTALTNAELLAILLGSGTRSLSAVDLAKKILAKANNSLDELSRKSIAELCKEKGIGDAKAITIVAALELSTRRQASKVEEKPVIKSSFDAFKVLTPYLENINHEEFFILLTNRASRVVKAINIGKGGLSAVVVDVRIIFSHAIENQASGIILAHNHPSGNLTPSDADIKLTKKVAEGCKIFDMMLLDHIIIAGNKYFSFADSGYM